MSAHPAGRTLKDFQRATVAHVEQHLLAPGSTGRYLVADEVGLGKTLVAGQIVIDLLEKIGGRHQADVVYLCSNLQIARQNRRHLASDPRVEIVDVDRVALLPFANRTKNWRLLSLTPSTSFDVHRGTGRVRERAGLLILLGELWDEVGARPSRAYRLFAGSASEDRVRATVRELRGSGGHRAADVEAFRRTLGTVSVAWSGPSGNSIREEVAELLSEASRAERPPGFPQRRNRAIGLLRQALAMAAIDRMRPALVIMDEFQRYPDLLEAGDDGRGAALAHRLLDRPECRTLLLSATPYRPPGGDGSGDDHHRDLRRTVSFLVRHDQAAVDAVDGALAQLRAGLFAIGSDGGAAALAARDLVATQLRPLMCRTERLRAEADRLEMLAAPKVGVGPLEAGDITSYLGLRDMASALGLDDPVEYWKSAPAVANGQRNYLLGRALIAASGRRLPALADAVERAGTIDLDAVRRYGELDLSHPMWRWLVAEVVETGAWRLLWIPPSLPAVAPTGPYADPQLANLTKRLVFSRWAMVPQLLSVLVSYEVERQAARRGGRLRFRGGTGARSTHGNRLAFKEGARGPSSMTHWGLVYPSFALASMGDLSEGFDDGHLPSRAEAVAVVERRVRARLRDLETRGRREGWLRTSGGADTSWYWRGGGLLDWDGDPRAYERGMRTRWQARALFGANGSRPDAFRNHTDEAVKVRPGTPIGPMPGDLPKVLARLALGGLGAASLRALARWLDADPRDMEVRTGAGSIALSLRALFTGPEAVEAVASMRHATGTPYWRQVTDYGIAGNLGSMLEELVATLGPDAPPGDETAVMRHIAEAVDRVIRLRTANYTILDVRARRDRMTAAPGKAMRGHYALRLGGQTDEGGALRDNEVRDAFNSPFWPFVLTTTSLGQEGLDFHTYCHSVVHWNLPTTAVDLEQRDGRVHRFLGHAVRRNLARANGPVGRLAAAKPWDAMVDAAVAARRSSDSDLVPWWVYTTGDPEDARIERAIPCLSLSKDAARYQELLRSLGLYRLTFGQPRPAELLAYLGRTELDEVLTEDLRSQLVVDLSPHLPATRAARTPRGRG